MIIVYKYWIFLAILLIATIMDICKYKISNKLIVIGLLLSMLFKLVNFGIRGVLQWSIGITIPVLIFFILFMAKMLGAGDIKLFSVIGGFLGVELLFKSIVNAFIVGALLSLLKLLYHNNLLFQINYLKNYILSVISSKKILKYYHKEDGSKNIIHFSIAIFIGVILVLLEEDLI